MIGYFRYFVSISLLGGLAGCALSPVDFEDTPPLPENYGVKVASVLFSIECEIIDALHNVRERARKDPDFGKRVNPDFLETLAARVNTTLNLVDQGNAELTLSPTVAMASAGTLSGGLTGRSNLHRTKESVVVSDVYFVEAIRNNKQKCIKTPTENDSDDIKDKLVRINGVLGFQDWIEQLVLGFSQHGTNLNRLNYNMTFALVNDAELGVTFEPVSNFVDRLGLNASASKKHTTTHKIEMQTIENPKLSKRTKTVNKETRVTDNEKKETKKMLDRAEYFSILERSGNPARYLGVPVR